MKTFLKKINIFIFIEITNCADEFGPRRKAPLKATFYIESFIGFSFLGFGADFARFVLVEILYRMWN